MGSLLWTGPAPAPASGSLGPFGQLSPPAGPATERRFVVHRRQPRMVSREGDRRVLAALKSHGSNPAEPAHMIHFLYFKSAQSANSAAEELRGAGYQNLRVHPAPTKSL